LSVTKRLWYIPLAWIQNCCALFESESDYVFRSWLRSPQSFCGSGEVLSDPNLALTPQIFFLSPNSLRPSCNLVPTVPKLSFVFFFAIFLPATTNPFKTSLQPRHRRPLLARTFILDISLFRFTPPPPCCCALDASFQCSGIRCLLCFFFLFLYVWFSPVPLSHQTTVFASSPWRPLHNCAPVRSGFTNIFSGHSPRCSLLPFPPPCSNSPSFLYLGPLQGLLFPRLGFHRTALTIFRQLPLIPVAPPAQ